MQKNNFTRIFLIVTIVCLLLRFFGFSKEHDSILNRDEAALAYNAFLLKESGKDEWSRSWPLTLESFGDYKLAGYSLSLIPFFAVFGYSDMVVRLPSILSGIVLVVVSYFFAGHFGLGKRGRSVFAFLVATAPVFFFYSRIAFEANVALTLLLSSLHFALLSNGKRWMQVLSVILMLFACITYNTPLLYLPFLGLFMIGWYGVDAWKKWLSLFFAYTLTAVFFFSVLSPLTAQKSSITIFSDELVWSKSVEYRMSLPEYLQQSLGSKYIYYFFLLATATIASFSPSFLAIRGGTHPWHTLPDWGNITWPVYIFSLVGVVVLITKVLAIAFARNSENIQNSKREVSLILLLGMSLIPSVITVDAPHTTRSLFFFYVLLLCGVKGVSSISRFKHWKKASQPVGFVFMLLTLLAFVLYTRTYFLKYPEQMKVLYQGGYGEIIQAVDKSTVANIAVVDGGGYQYILTAWYLKMTPERFFSTVIRQNPDKIGFRYGEKVGKYHFIVEEKDRSNLEEILLTWDGSVWRQK